MSELSVHLRHETQADAPIIDKLHERAFGPGRFARTAYRLREGIAPLSTLCHVATVGTLIVGSIRLSGLWIGSEKAVLLGPLTVEPQFMNRGIGGLLIKRALEVAKQEGHQVVILVGDEPYYARAGFKKVPRGHLHLPGPVDPDRLLAVDLQGGDIARLKGPVLPRAA
jgi:predicted N-acetyltransferase YhbS